MGEFLDYFKNKKSLATLLILGILVLAIPLSINLLRQQQIIRSRATQDPIVFVAGPNVSQKTDGSWVTKSTTVSLQLTSPLGPPGSPAAPPPPPGSTTVTETCDGVSCTFVWPATSVAGKTVTSYTLRINKDPATDWSPGTASGDVGVTTPNSNPTLLVYLTPGHYGGGTLQRHFSDGTQDDVANGNISGVVFDGFTVSMNTSKTCTEVITHACPPTNPLRFELPHDMCLNFPRSCDVPTGWTVQ